MYIIKTIKPLKQLKPYESLNKNLIKRPPECCQGWSQATLSGEAVPQLGGHYCEGCLNLLVEHGGVLPWLTTMYRPVYIGEGSPSSTLIQGCLDSNSVQLELGTESHWEPVQVLQHGSEMLLSAGALRRFA